MPLHFDSRILIVLASFALSLFCITVDILNVDLSRTELITMQIPIEPIQNQRSKNLSRYKNGCSSCYPLINTKLNKNVKTILLDFASDLIKVIKLKK